MERNSVPFVGGAAFCRLRSAECGPSRAEMIEEEAWGMTARSEISPYLRTPTRNSQVRMG